MVFVPTEQVLLEIAALVAGLLAGAVSVRFGGSRRWMGSVVLLSFIAVCFALGTFGYVWFGGFPAGTAAGVVWGRVVSRRSGIMTGPGFVERDWHATFAVHIWCQFGLSTDGIENRGGGSLSSRSGE